MKAAVYVRVSTLEQATDGYSIGVQKEKLINYATMQGHDVVEVYSDEGWSGKTLSRPAVEKMLNDIKNGLVSIVLIYKLDRLSRHVKDVLELVDLFEKYNVKLYSLNENLDLSSPFGRAALKMSATFSELERETIVERMQMGKNARAKAGKYTCPGTHCPFGYIHDKEHDKMLINPEEAEAIKKVFELYINQDYSFRKLYDYCREAYPTIKYFGNQMCCKPIIERVMYSGYFIKDDVLIKGTNFEPIINYETYLQAQTKVEQNRTKRSSENTPYLLTGLIFCARCGNRYVGKLYDRFNYKPNGERTKSYKYRTYGCAARVKRDKNYMPANCDNDIYSYDELEQYVENYVRHINFTDFVSGEYIPGFIDKLIAENAGLKARNEKLLDLYLDNSIDKDSYTLRLVEIEAKINENKMLIESEKSKVQTNPTTAISVINENLKNYNTLTKKEKTLLLHFIIKSIIVDGKKITINLRIK